MPKEGIAGDRGTEDGRQDNRSDVIDAVTMVRLKRISQDFEIGRPNWLFFGNQGIRKFNYNTYIACIANKTGCPFREEGQSRGTAKPLRSLARPWLCPGPGPGPRPGHAQAQRPI